MGVDKINSFPKIGAEYFFPFFLEGIGYNKCEEDIMRKEGYPNYLILYASEGKGEVCVGGERFLLEENGSFVLRKNYPHSYRALTDNWNTHWIAFDGYAVDKMLDVMHIGDYAVFHDLQLEGLHSLFRKIYLYSTEQNEYGNFDISVMVYQFLVEYNKLINYSGQDISFNCNHDAVLAAKRFIEQYYFKDIKLADIAEYAFVSPQHLCRLFQLHMRMTPKQYLLQIRLKIAKIYLRNTIKSIGQIAEDVGFNSSYYFSIMFKKQENMTPSQYRSRSK